MERLNRDFAGDAHPTDVLSFEGSGDHVGDIAISWPRVVAQAEEWGHGDKEELAVLLVHGFLHLLGWDHATPAENEEMWRLTYSAYTPRHGLQIGRASCRERVLMYDEQ